MASERLLVSIDNQQVRRQFRRAARRGVDDPLAREIGRRMEERLDYVRISPQRILDLGSGASCAAQALHSRYPEATVYALDAVPELLPSLSSSRRRPWWLGWLRQKGHGPIPVGGDARNLPFQKDAFDLIWCNQLLPWIDDISSVITEAHRVLKTGGLLTFSTLGPDTLQTLAACFRDARPHCHAYPDMHDIGDLLARSGFSEPVVDMEVVTVQYATLSRLLGDLRAAAAICAHPARRRGLTSRQFWRDAENAWKKQATSNGDVSVNFEIVYGHAWASPIKAKTGQVSVIHFEGSQKQHRHGGIAG